MAGSACGIRPRPAPAPALRVSARAGAGVPARLRRRFGIEAAAVATRGPVEPIAPGLPMLKCEVGWAVAAEGAVSTADVERRLRLDLVPAWREAARDYVDAVVSAGC